MSFADYLYSHERLEALTVSNETIARHLRQDPLYDNEPLANFTSVMLVMGNVNIILSLWY